MAWAQLELAAWSLTDDFVSSIENLQRWLERQRAARLD